MSDAVKARHSRRGQGQIAPAPAMVQTVDAVQSHHHALSILFGLMAVLVAIVLYSGNFVISRYGVTSYLTAYDLLALRYGIAGLLMLPLLYKSGMRDLGGIGWRRGWLLTVLAGAPYMFLILFGLHYAPAAHGSILNPGAVPVTAALCLWWLKGKYISSHQVLALLLICQGMFLLAWPGFGAGDLVILGDAVLLLSGISWGVFTVLIQHWGLNPLRVASAVSVLSMVYLPWYFMFYDSALDQAPFSHVMLHGLNQGVLTAVLAMFLFAYGVRKLGSRLTSVFMPLIPVVVTLVSIPVLGEEPGGWQSFGIVVTVVGMFYAVLVRR